MVVDKYTKITNEGIRKSPNSLITYQFKHRKLNKITCLYWEQIKPVNWRKGITKRLSPHIWAGAGEKHYT
jgi:hypothetical protein